MCDGQFHVEIFLLSLDIGLRSTKPLPRVRSQTRLEAQISSEYGLGRLLEETDDSIPVCVIDCRKAEMKEILIIQAVEEARRFLISKLPRCALWKAGVSSRSVI
jgi:hypothetical protein